MLVKIRWLGPALVIMREDDESGKPSVYWISHGTQLLRCAPHHVRPDFRTSETKIGGLEIARKVNRAVAELEHHMDTECPLHMAILVTEENPTWWHTNIMCPGIVHNATVQHVRPRKREHSAERRTTP